MKSPSAMTFSTRNRMKFSAGELSAKQRRDLHVRKRPSTQQKTKRSSWSQLTEKPCVLAQGFQIIQSVNPKLRGCACLQHIRAYAKCVNKQSLLRTAFWTNKGNFALCSTFAMGEVRATQDSVPRPCDLRTSRSERAKRIDQNFWSI